jgi:hypothetical protein
MRVIFERHFAIIFLKVHAYCMQELIDRYPESVEWYRPLFKESSCWQVGVMQGINEADRKDPSMWYVITRRGKNCDNLTINVNVSLFKSKDMAHDRASQLFSIKLKTHGKLSPCAKAVNNLDSPFSTHSSTQKKWCIQPVVKGITVFAWVDGQTDYVQMCVHGGTVFIDLDTPHRHNLRIFLSSILRRFPNMFVCGILDEETFWVYDLLQFPEEKNLIERLIWFFEILEGSLKAHSGRCVSLAPFQIASSPKEVKEHSEIFIQCGHYDQLMIR